MSEKKGTFLGKGWAFPPSFIKGSNSVEMVSDEKDIEQSIQIILGTIPGERMMAPEFGCSMYKYVFESKDPTHMTMLKDAVYDALLYHEPRIKVLKISLDAEESNENLVHIHIDYKVIITNSRSNIVFPYYLKEGTNI